MRPAAINLVTHAESSAGQTVAVVGAGICGGLAALFLARSGYRVVLISAGGDPRRCTREQARSSTAGGESPRFVTLYEGLRYPGQSLSSADPCRWQQTVSQGGWLGRAFDKMSTNDRHWVEARIQSIKDPPRPASGWHLAISLHSLDCWRELIADHPGLFGPEPPTAKSMLHAYSDSHSFEQARDACRTSECLVRTLSPQQLAAEIPALHLACENGMLAGATEVPGFAFNVTAFMASLLSELERLGTSFEWNNECTGVRTSNTRVEALVCTNGDIRTHHFLIFPGAYSPASLFDSLGVRISGIAGRWLLLPSPAGFGIPAKLSCHHDIECARPPVDLNIMPCRIDGAEMLAIGGGQIHVGAYPFSYDPQEMHSLDLHVQTTLKSLLPVAVEEAERSGQLQCRPTLCVRSFAPDNQPAIAIRETTTGGNLLLCSGLGAAAAALAPATARLAARFTSTRDNSLLTMLGAASL